MQLGRRAALGGLAPIVTSDARAAEQGAKVELESRAEFAGFIDQEIVRWNRVAKAATIQLE